MGGRRDDECQGDVCMYVWVYSSSNGGTGYKVMIVESFYSGGEGYLQ